MAEALQFFRDNEIWIYLLLGALAVWQIQRFIVSWQALRGAAFGMEREGAQERINTATLLLVVFLMAAIAEFTLVSFVAPSVPGAIPIPSPTLNLLATPTITLPASAAGTLTPPAEAQPTTIGMPAENGCVEGQLFISSPIDGDEIRDIVTLEGTVNLPNLGFYKYEIARPGETIWLTIGGDRINVMDGKLGEWDTTTRTPGEYLLRLVATDSQANYLPPCVIRVVIGAPSTKTP